MPLVPEDHVDSQSKADDISDISREELTKTVLYTTVKLTETALYYRVWKKVLQM